MAALTRRSSRIGRTGLRGGLSTARANVRGARALVSARARILSGFAALIALQLGVACAVWRADRQLDRSIVLDAQAETTRLRLGHTQALIGQARQDLSNYIRTGAAVDRLAVDASLAKLGAAVTAKDGQAAAPDIRTLLTPVETEREALTAVIHAAEQRRAAFADLTQACAGLENGTFAIAQEILGAASGDVVDAGLVLMTAVNPLLIAGGHYALTEEFRDAEIARADLKLAQDRLGALRQAADPAPRRLQRLLAAESAALDAVGTALETVADSLGLRARKLSALDKAAGDMADAIAALSTTIAETRERRRHEMLAARTALGSTVVVATGGSLVLGFALSGLVGAERRRAAATLQTMNRRFDTALRNMSQGLCLFDEDGRLTVVNQRFCEIYGLAPDRVTLGSSFEDLLKLLGAAGHLSPGASPKALAAAWTERLAPRQRGALLQEISGGRAVAISYQPTVDGGWVATYEDVTEQRRIDERIAFMARHDSLTELPNRVLFHERVEQAMAQAGRGKPAAILALDLDRFKAVNDTFGHAVGDKLLCAVADRLRACTREVDTVARLGGDEFAIVQMGLERSEDAGLLARRVVDVLSQPYELDGHQAVIGASVGVVIVPAEGAGADTLLKNADLALYRAKSDGRGTYRYFEPEMDDRMQARRELETDVRRALANAEFEVFYQPLVSLRSDAICGFEALLRWRHTARGLVSPAEFIPVAEDLGLIVPIGEWVLHQACAEAAGWPGALKVAVNLSPVQFKKPHLVSTVASALRRSGLAAQRLELEITESVLLQENETTLETLHTIRGLGVQIALDDFGTGYSSLSYLRSFPFDKIKIDQSFIRDLPGKEDSVAIVRAVTGLGVHLGMSTTAEGVETSAQLAHLRAERCTEAQGYLFSPPCPAADVATLLQRSRTPDWLAGPARSEQAEIALGGGMSPQRHPSPAVPADERQVSRVSDPAVPILAAQ